MDADAASSSAAAPLLVREEDLRQLESFCRRLRAACAEAGLETPQIHRAWLSHVRAECVRCGIHVSGEELFALSEPPSADHSTAKIGRLRLGDCARHGCEAYHYRLSFRSQPEIDWAMLLAQADLLQAQRGLGRKTPPARGWLEMRWFFGWRTGMACLALVLLLVWRQSYYGGRIFLIREPEQFRVDPGSEGELM